MIVVNQELNMGDTNEFRLSDKSIGQIAKLVQLGILTGTDIIDHLRMMILTSKDGQLVPSAEYSKVFDDSVQKLADKADELMQSANSNRADNR